MEHEANLNNSFQPWFKKQCHIPILSKLIRNRWHAFFLITILAFYFILSGIGFIVWQCPMKTTLGVPCPGCGLSSAILDLLQGEWRSALTKHAFSPLFLFAYFLAVGISLLPSHLHSVFIKHIADFEVRTGLINYIFIALIIYWIFRLFFKNVV